MTDTAIGSWCGRTLRVIHAPGRRTRWRLEVTPHTTHTDTIFRAWLGESWQALTGFYYSLQLQESRVLTAAVARWIHACGDARRAAQWLEELQQVEPEMRLQFVEAAIPHAKSAPPVELMRLASPGGGYREELSGILSAVARRLAPDFIRQSVAYSRWAGFSIPWENAAAHATFPTERAMELLIRSDAQHSLPLCRHLWLACVKHTRLGELLSASWWDALDTTGVCGFLDVLAFGVDNLAPASVAAGLAEAAAEYLTLTPEERKLAVSLPYRSLLCLPRYTELLRRVPPGMVPGVAEWRHLLEPVKALPREYRAAFTEAPQASFDALFKAYRRNNERELVYEGLLAMFATVPQRALAAFRIAPKHLVQAARSIGALGERHATSILRSLRRHELFTIEIAGGDLVALDNLLMRHAPLAKRLRRFHEWDQHFSGRKPMPLNGVAQAFGELREQIALLAIWSAEHAVKEHLAFDPHTHAALRYSEKNRRVLARFLRRPHLDFIDAHPATQAWRQRHSSVDVDRWRRGVPFERNGVRLAMEHDYREVLRMGTYVGSCLGLGGHNMFNAATVLLDINKQVIFARNAEGKFVARQLVAIDHQNRLVCFPVYAVNNRDQWQPLFADYNRALAWALGLTIHTGWDYQIPNVIARDWYDDGLWDLVIEQDRIAA